MTVELKTPIWHQFAVLLLLAMPVACAAWTVTHEEVFRETRDFCKRMSQSGKALPRRKFFYLFTCDYCFSHYVAALAVWIFRLAVLYDGWRGHLAAWLSLVWLANVYMGLFNRLRLEIKEENVKIAVEQAEVEAVGKGQLSLR